MTTDFVFFSASRDELKEIHRALLTRYVMTNAMRREQGLETTDYPPILEKIERLMGVNPEAAHTLFHRVEDELWEHSWYVYTDEWALYRAKQDVTRELGVKLKAMKEEDVDALIEKRYEEQFETYVAEVDMHEERKEENNGKKKARHGKPSKRT